MNETRPYKSVITRENLEGRQRPYYIKSLDRENGVHVRVSGTSRPADAYMIKELMFEGVSRSFDQMICTGWMWQMMRLMRFVMP